MLSLKCQDLGMDCSNKEEAETKDELMEKIKRHFESQHYSGGKIPKNKMAEIEKAIKHWVGDGWHFELK